MQKYDLANKKQDVSIRSEIKRGGNRTNQINTRKEKTTTIDPKAKPKDPHGPLSAIKLKNNRDSKSHL